MLIGVSLNMGKGTYTEKDCGRRKILLEVRKDGLSWNIEVEMSSEGQVEM